MDLLTLIEQAQSSDGATRSNAERQLEECIKLDAARVFVGLAEILANRENNINNRNMAGLYLKIRLHGRTDETQEAVAGAWLALPEEARKRVKDMVAMTLGDDARDARAAAAQVVARIGIIEIPHGAWPELIPGLLENVIKNPTAKDLKQATLNALGYICEEIHPIEALTPQANQILIAVIHGMRKEEPSSEVRLAATEALLNTLEFVRGNFENETERNVVFKVVLECTQDAEPRIRKASFECIVKIATKYYDKLEAWMQHLFDVSLAAIKNDVEQVAQQGIEFWSSLCDVEMDILIESEERAERGLKPTRHSFGYVKAALGHLVPILTESMTKQEDEEQDEDAWNVAAAAGACLSLCSQTVGDDIMAVVLPFVQANINSDNWRFKEAAILAFGSILDGPRSVALKEVVGQALPVLLSHHRDPALLVRDTNAWTIGRICSLHPDVVYKYLGDVLTVIAGGLQDAPRVAANMCWAINGLASAHQDDDEAMPTNPLSAHFKGMVETLLGTTEREDADESNLRTAAYEAVNMLIQNGARDVLPVVNEMLPHLLSKLESTFTIGIVSQDDAALVAELQGHLCGLLMACANRLGKRVSPHADRMMTNFLRVFSAGHSTVHEEALMAIGQMANALEADFARYMEAFGEWLVQALRNHHEWQVCIVAIGVVGDICRALGDAMVPYCDVIMEVMLSMADSADTLRDIKPPIFSCIGDVALAINGNFVKYLEASMRIMMTNASTYKCDDTSDYDALDFVNALREELLEGYTGIIQGLRSSGQAEALLPYVPHIVQFVCFVWSNKMRTETVTRGAVGVLGDLGHACGARAAEYLKIDQVGSIVGEASRSTNPQTVKVARWAMQTISKM